MTDIWDYDPETYGRQPNILREGINRFEIVDIQEQYRKGEVSSLKLSIRYEDNEYPKYLWLPIKGAAGALLDSVGENWKNYVGKEVDWDTFIGRIVYADCKTQPKNGKSYVNPVRLVPYDRVPQALKTYGEIPSTTPPAADEPSDWEDM
jgi:hypothetical protein